MSELRSQPDYHCPGCGQPAMMAMTGRFGQAFCGNHDDCAVLCWDPWQRYTAQDLETMNVVDLSALSALTQKDDSDD